MKPGFKPKLATNAEEEARLQLFLESLPPVPEDWAESEVHRVNTYEAPGEFIKVYSNSTFRVSFRSTPKEIAVSMSRKTGAALQRGDTISVARLFFPHTPVVIREPVPGLAYFEVTH